MEKIIKKYYEKFAKISLTMKETFNCIQCNKSIPLQEERVGKCKECRGESIEKGKII